MDVDENVEEWDDVSVINDIDRESEPEGEISFTNTSPTAVALVRWLTLLLHFARCMSSFKYCFVLPFWILVNFFCCSRKFQ